MTSEQETTWNNLHGATWNDLKRPTASRFRDYFTNSGNPFSSVS